MSSKNVSSENVSSKNVSSNVIERKKSSAFLQSVKAVITDKYENCSTNVRILFHNGSQKSFLTQEIAEELKLRSIRKERLIVNGFRGKEEKLVNLEVVLVSVHNTHGEPCGVIELYIVPFICKPYM